MPNLDVELVISDLTKVYELHVTHRILNAAYRNVFTKMYIHTNEISNRSRNLQQNIQQTLFKYTALKQKSTKFPFCLHTWL